MSDMTEPNDEMRPDGLLLMYHASPWANRSSIRESGLIAEYALDNGSSFPGVFMSVEPVEPNPPGTDPKWGQDVWGVNTDGLHLEVDGYSGEASASYESEVDIPADRLRLVRSAEGHPDDTE